MDHWQNVDAGPRSESPRARARCLYVATCSSRPAEVAAVIGYFHSGSAGALARELTAFKVRNRR
jgi:hypothetical protein